MGLFITLAKNPNSNLVLFHGACSEPHPYLRTHCLQTHKQYLDTGSICSLPLRWLFCPPPSIYFTPIPTFSHFLFVSSSSEIEKWHKSLTQAIQTVFSREEIISKQRLEERLTQYLDHQIIQMEDRLKRKEIQLIDAGLNTTPINKITSLKRGKLVLEENNQKTKMYCLLDKAFFYCFLDHSKKTHPKKKIPLSSINHVDCSQRMLTLRTDHESVTFATQFESATYGWIEVLFPLLNWEVPHDL